MTPLTLNLPSGSRCSNFLYLGMAKEYLTQDLLTVELPNGYYIDVGWIPEHDPDGRFEIHVFRESWDYQILDQPLVAKYLTDVVRNVEALAQHFSRSEVPGFRSGVTTVKVDATNTRGQTRATFYAGQVA